MVFQRRADDGPTLNAGLLALIFQGFRTSIAKVPYIFVLFSVGGGRVRTPCPLPLDPPMTYETQIMDQCVWYSDRIP